DHLGLSATAVEDRVRHGAAGMPAFSGQLSDQQITQVARFVAESSH
ncbi:c-type cytochrome, partial [Streptomyces scabiei]